MNFLKFLNNSFLLMDRENSDDGNAGENYSSESLESIADEVLNGIPGEGEKPSGDDPGEQGSEQTENSGETETDVDKLLAVLDKKPEESETKEGDDANSPFLKLNLGGDEKSLSEDEVRDYVAKGFEHSHALQNLEQEKKSFETEVSQVREELKTEIEAFKKQEAERQEQLEQLTIWDDYINHLEKSDPELLEQIREGVSKFSIAYQNPTVKNLKNELADLKKQISGQFQEKENQKIVEQLDNEMSHAKKELDAPLSKLGLKVDWDKVKDFWAKNESLSLKQSIYALYGESLDKLRQSKAKVAQTKVRANRRPQSPVSSSGGTPGEKGKNFSSMTHMQAAEEVARGLGF